MSKLALILCLKIIVLSLLILDYGLMCVYSISLYCIYDLWLLCPSSLNCFWCKTLSPLQEHVVHYVVKLLASPVPHSHSGTRSLYVDNMSMLSAVLRGASCVDTVQILSLHGVVSESPLQYTTFDIWWLYVYDSPFRFSITNLCGWKFFGFTWQLAAIENYAVRPCSVLGICSHFNLGIGFGLWISKFHI